MSNNEEEKQLKALTELILQSLEANGSLSSIKAKLRQTVYTAVNDENAPSSNSKDPNMKTSKAQPVIKGSKQLYKPSSSGSTAQSSESSSATSSSVLRAIRSSEDEKLTLLLVKDLLQSYNMDYSLNTFSNETNLLADVDRANLAAQTSTNRSTSKPLLVQLVAAAMNGTLASASSSNNTAKPSTAGQTSKTTKPTSDSSMKSSENLSNSRKFSSFNTKQNYESNGIEESMGGFDGLSIDEEDEDEEVQKIGKNGKSSSQAATKKTKNNKTNPMFSSMDETIGASMSHGYDQSVDSMDLEQDYDYYEDIKK